MIPCDTGWGFYSDELRNYKILPIISGPENCSTLERIAKSPENTNAAPIYFWKALISLPFLMFVNA